MSSSRNSRTGSPLIFYIIFTIMHWTYGARNFDIRMIRLTYELYNKTLFPIFELTLQEPKSGHNSMHLELEPSEALIQFGVVLDLKVPRKNLALGRLTKLTLDGCDFFSSNFSRNLIAEKVLAALRYGNSVIPKRCPFEAYKRVIIDRFYLHAEDFLPVLPAMTIFANFSVTVGKKLAFSILPDFEITQHS